MAACSCTLRATRAPLRIQSPCSADRAIAAHLRRFSHTPRDGARAGRRTRFPLPPSRSEWPFLGPGPERARLPLPVTRPTSSRDPGGGQVVVMATAAIWGCCVKRVWLYCLPGTPTLPNSIVRAGRPNIPAWLTQSWRVMLIAVLFMVGSERVGELEGVLVFVQSAPAISLRGRVMHESWIMHEFAACLSFVVGGFYYS